MSSNDHKINEEKKPVEKVVLKKSEKKLIGITTIMNYVYRSEKYRNICLYD